MNRPKVSTKKEYTDVFLDVFAMFSVILMFVFVTDIFNQLPDTIPTHYNFASEPDSYSSKFTLWLIPIISLILFLGLSILNKYPHIFNYPTKITEENAVKHYKYAARLIRVLNLIISSCFLYVTYSGIQTALGNANGLTNYFVIVFLVLIFGAIGFYLVFALKNK